MNPLQPYSCLNTRRAVQTLPYQSILGARRRHHEKPAAASTLNQRDSKTTDRCRPAPPLRSGLATSPAVEGRRAANLQTMILNPLAGVGRQLVLWSIARVDRALAHQKHHVACRLGNRFVLNTGRHH